MTKEFVRITCDACEKPLCYAVNPKHIPKTWCDGCVETWKVEEKEYEHPDD